MTNRSNHAWTAAALAICAMAWSAPGSAHDANGPQQCSLHTLSGSYVLAASGFTIPPGTTTALPKAIIEQLRFDGEGAVTSPNATVSMNGTLRVTTGSVGTYSLLADCTGTLNFSDGLSHTIYMGPDGDEGWFIQNTAPNNSANIFQGTLARVSPSRSRRDGH